MTFAFAAFEGVLLVLLDGMFGPGGNKVPPLIDVSPFRTVLHVINY